MNYKEVLEGQVEELQKAQKLISAELKGKADCKIAIAEEIRRIVETIQTLKPQITE